MQLVAQVFLNWSQSGSKKCLSESAASACLIHNQCLTSDQQEIVDCL